MTVCESNLATVTSKTPAKFFTLKKSSYVQIYIDRLNEMATWRHKLLKENYSPFNVWDDNRLKNMLLGAKERVLNVEECLLREQ